MSRKIILIKQELLLLYQDNFSTQDRKSGSAGMPRPISSSFPYTTLFRSADVLAAQPVTTNLLKFMRASIKMIGVSNLQSFIASMTQKLTLSDISDESKNYLDKAGITTALSR